jgi:hypothetical protein
MCEEQLEGEQNFLLSSLLLCHQSNYHYLLYKIVNKLIRQYKGK